MASREKETDKLVMGASAKDSLKGMTRFGAKEGTIVWPSWQAELRRKVVFEMGAVGMKIIEGELSSKDIKVQMKAEEIGDLLKSLLTRGRAGVKYDEDWTGGCSTDDEEDGEASNVFLNQVMTTVGVLNVQQAIENIKKSYFLSIEEYGLVQATGSRRLRMRLWLRQTKVQRLRLQTVCGTTASRKKSWQLSST